MGRRPDGHHELESLFLPLDLADRLELSAEPAAATQIELELAEPGSGTPASGENLAWRAAAAFLEAAGLRRRVRLRLTKRIPVAAGLGGGSSDAAAVLRGLAELNPGALAERELERLALGLGADVPFFLDPRPALVTGIGERREPPPAPLPPQLLVLANPGVGLSTAKVFRAFAALTRPPRPSTLRSLLEATGGVPADPARLQALLANDLEPVAERLCPPIGRLRAALREAGARAVAMSGSGATVFGVFGEETLAAAAAARIGTGGAWARVARTKESR